MIVYNDKMIIKTIEDEQRKINKHGHEVITFDDREFENEIYIAPYEFDSHGEYHWLNFLKVMNNQNVKVISVMGKNHIPMASIISNEMVLIPQDLSQLFTTVSRVVTDNKVLDIYRPTYLHKKEPIVEPQYDIKSLVGFYLKRPIYIDAKALNRYQNIRNDYENNLNICLYKKTRYEKLVGKLKGFFKSQIFFDDNWKLTKRIYEQMESEVLTFQLMSSIEKNWRYVCCGGITNLFIIVPCNVLAATDYMTHRSGMRYKARTNKIYWNRKTAFVKHSVDRSVKPRRFRPTDNEEDKLASLLNSIIGS